MTITTQYESIYLEPGPPGSERRWCEDKIDDGWVEYARVPGELDLSAALMSFLRGVSEGDMREALGDEGFERLVQRGKDVAAAALSAVSGAEATEPVGVPSRADYERDVDELMNGNHEYRACLDVCDDALRKALAHSQGRSRQLEQDRDIEAGNAQRWHRDCELLEGRVRAIVSGRNALHIELNQMLWNLRSRVTALEDALRFATNGVGGYPSPEAVRKVARSALLSETAAGHAHKE